IERGGNVLRLMIVDQLPQHRHETVDGVRRLAIGTGQPADRVVRAIHLRAAVYEVQTRRAHWGGKLQYIIRLMLSRTRVVLLAVLVAAAAATACGRGAGLLSPQYEYEEDVTLKLDGSATLVVNASIPALIALRGLPLDPNPRVRADDLRRRVREVYTSPQAEVLRVDTWTKSGRRFVGGRPRIPHIRALPQAPPF